MMWVPLYLLKFQMGTEEQGEHTDPRPGLSYVWSYQTLPVPSTNS